MYILCCALYIKIGIFIYLDHFEYVESYSVFLEFVKNPFHRADSFVIIDVTYYAGILKNEGQKALPNFSIGFFSSFVYYISASFVLF
jgi:hypothetical protein